MDISLIEAKIIEKLAADITDLKVEGFPENPSAYRKTQAKGVILVQWIGSKYGEPIERDNPIQLREPKFFVTVSVKKLRDHNSAYSYMEEIRKSLSGFVPEVSGTACKAMYPLQEKFVSENNGVWTYGILFNLTNIEYFEQEV